MEFSPSLQLFHNHLGYDLTTPVHNRISASQFNSSIRQLYLKRKVNSETKATTPYPVKAKIGTAVHSMIENLWLNPEAVNKLYGEGTWSVNNNPPIHEDTLFIITVEKRTERVIKSSSGKEYLITGKFDVVISGEIYDIKTTFPANFSDEVTLNKYKEQLSIYKWLNPELITSKAGYIDFIFSSWRPSDEPKHPMVSKQIVLDSVEVTEAKLVAKLDALEVVEETGAIPECTDDDLWVRTTESFSVWVTGFNPEKRASRVFATEQEAKDFVIGHKNLKCEYRKIVKKSEPIACNYCICRNICDQYNNRIKRRQINDC